MSEDKIVKIETTCPSKKEALELCQIVVERNLAAAGQITKARSIYWWEGEIVEEKEWILTLISKESLFKEADKTIQSFHPYDIPEIIQIPIDRASEDYLIWIKYYTK